MELILISLAVGIAVGFIVVNILKSQLKSVRRQSGAADYITSNSLHLSVSQDIYLYRRVTRTPKSKKN